MDNGSFEVGGKNGVGTGVRKTCAACRDESEPPFPESGGTIPKAYKPPATAPAIIRTSNSISRIEGPEYSGCLWAMAKDYKPQIVAQVNTQIDCQLNTYVKTGETGDC